MKNPFYVVETFHATSGWDYPDWHKESNHGTLNAALEKKSKMLKLTKEDYNGKAKPIWHAKNIRIVEHTKKVIR